MSRWSRYLLCIWTFVTALASAQSNGYVGYDLNLEGDKDSVIFSTDETRPNAANNFPSPDVYLNASVHVGTIDLEVDNLVSRSRKYSHKNCADS